MHLFIRIDLIIYTLNLWYLFCICVFPKNSFYELGFDHMTIIKFLCNFILFRVCHFYGKKFSITHINSNKFMSNCIQFICNFRVVTMSNQLFSNHKNNILI